VKKNYICNCSNYDFSNKKFSYWENRDVTKDEKEIVSFLKKKKLKNLSIFHIGIGNSYVYENLKINNTIYGITISNIELQHAKLKNKINYKVYYCNKFSKQLVKIFRKKKFDIVIDNNLKSYACCQKSFNYMFKNITFLLKKDGLIITTKNGMFWYKKLMPKLSFNIKKLFFYKLKEINGKISNILSFREARNLSNKFSLILHENKNIIYFKKK